MPLSSSYHDPFIMKRMLSSELNKPDVLLRYRMMGFVYIRVHHLPHFENIVRCPTVGRYVEIFKVPHLGTAHMDSKQGQKILNKLCYFY